MGTLAQDAQPQHFALLTPPTPTRHWPACWPAGDSLQAVALGPREVHVAAQGTVEILQGFLCHLHLPLGHEDVLAREAPWSARVRQGTGEGPDVAFRRTLPFLTCTSPGPP